jgi:hypothetical protein
MQKYEKGKKPHQRQLNISAASGTRRRFDSFDFNLQRMCADASHADKWRGAVLSFRPEKWCKRAIWGNTLPAIKHIWKSVDNLTSGAFVKMWQQQVDRFYTRYSEATTK